MIFMNRIFLLYFTDHSDIWDNKNNSFFIKKLSPQNPHKIMGEDVEMSGIQEELVEVESEGVISEPLRKSKRRISRNWHRKVF